MGRVGTATDRTAKATVGAGATRPEETGVATFIRGQTTPTRSATNSSGIRSESSGTSSGGSNHRNSNSRSSLNSSIRISLSNSSTTILVLNGSSSSKAAAVGGAGVVDPSTDLMADAERSKGMETLPPLTRSSSNGDPRTGMQT
ncbi:unnamed protein product [Ectocarpus sp. CCAP 1310/34]|nr:unnamed protein product [Ectocarpus sp. CCAP 1310/34]